MDPRWTKISADDDFNSFKVEKKLLMEEDNIVQARIASLINLFVTNNSEEGSQMILNSLETYKRLLITEPELQNKISGQTLESLIKALLVIMCHRKEYDHLNSLVRSTTEPPGTKILPLFVLLSDKIPSQPPQGPTHHQRDHRDQPLSAEDARV